MTSNVAQSGCDIMHTVDLGIWVHLITSIAVKLDKTMKKYGILPAHRIAAVWEKLASRGLALNADECLFKLNSYKANYLKILVEEKKQVGSNSKAKGKKAPQAWEHHLLMNVSDVALDLSTWHVPRRG
jgi:hypothetical protein